MKKILSLSLLLLTGCVKPMPAARPLTTAEYCGQQLGLKYGTRDYAKCGIAYDQLKINAYNSSANMIRARNSGASNIYVHHTY